MECKESEESLRNEDGPGPDPDVGIRIVNPSGRHTFHEDLVDIASLPSPQSRRHSKSILSITALSKQNQNQPLAKHLDAPSNSQQTPDLSAIGNKRYLL